MVVLHFEPTDEKLLCEHSAIIVITVVIITIITLGPKDKVVEFPHKVSKRLDFSNFFNLLLYAFFKGLIHFPLLCDLVVKD